MDETANVHRCRRPFCGIPLAAIPTVIRLRLTVCREYGHTNTEPEGYCINCGAPWLPQNNGSSRRTHEDR